MAYYPCRVILLVTVLFSAGNRQAIAVVDDESTPPAEGQPPQVPEPTSLQQVASVPVSPEDATFVVFLTTSSSRYLCGGVLVGRQAVLTTASCIRNEPLPQVVVGSIDNTRTSGPGVQVIGVTEVVYHPSFLQNGNPNLAIVRLSGSADVKPVKVSTTGFGLYEGAFLNMFGWGRLTSFSSSAAILQNTKIMYIPNPRCSLKLRKILPEHEICMGGEGSGSCNGSDGGPILSLRSLVGLIGQSHVCGQIGQLDVHINILPYAAWIKSFSS